MSTPVPRRLKNTNLALDAPTSCATTTTVEHGHRSQDTSTTQTPAEQAKEVLDSSPSQGEATASAQAPSKESSARSTENALEQQAQAKPAIVHGVALLYLHTSSLHA
jgi:FtsZ-interacting cell division protein ZipA